MSEVIKIELSDSNKQNITRLLDQLKIVTPQVNAATARARELVLEQQVYKSQVEAIISSVANEQGHTEKVFALDKDLNLIEVVQQETTEDKTE